MAKKRAWGGGAFSLKHSSEVRSREQGVEITHGDSEAHSLTCKSPQCRTGNAWGYLSRADKTTQLHFLKTATAGIKLSSTVGDTLGGEPAPLWALAYCGN